MLKNKNFLPMIRLFISMGNREIVESTLEFADLNLEGPDYLAVRYTIFLNFLLVRNLLRLKRHYLALTQ